MSLCVLIVDPGVSAGAVAGWPAGVRSLGLTHPADVGAVVSWVAGLEATDVVVLARPRSARDARRMATTIAGALPGTAATVLLRETTTVALAAAASHALERNLDPPLAVLAISDALERSLAGAYLTRVTNLERPKPSMWQHITSIFGRRHIALVGEKGRVHRAGHPLDLPEGCAVLIAADEDSREFSGLVEALGSPEDVHAVPVVVPTASGFKSAGAEFIAFVAPPDRVGQRRCPTCHNRADQQSCPFCRALTRYQEPAA